MTRILRRHSGQGVAIQVHRRVGAQAHHLAFLEDQAIGLRPPRGAGTLFDSPGEGKADAQAEGGRAPTAAGTADRA